MNKFTVFINKNKFPIILLAIYIIYTILTWGKWGDAMFDCFREAIIPQNILDGGKIFRDITCLYPPLSYYIHAFLFLIFGQSLNVLYMVSIILSLTIYSLIYFIIKKKSSEITAFIAIFSIMSALTFRIQLVHNTVSWYFPYSYSLLYALTLMIAAFVFLVLYRENKKISNLYICFLFAGISAAFKFDYLAFILIPIYYALKTKSLKSIFTSLGYFLLPIIIELIIFFIMGGRYSDLVNEIHLLKSFSSSPAVKIYHTYFIPFFINVNLLPDIWYSFWTFCKIFSIFFVTATFFQTIIFEIKNVKFKILTYSIEFLLLFSMLFLIYPTQKEEHLHSNFAFLPTFLIICVIYILLSHIFNNKKTLPDNTKFFILLFLTSVLFAIKTPLIMYISNIGNFNICLYTVTFIYLLAEIFPQATASLFNPKCVKSIFVISLFFYFATYIFVFFDNSKFLKFDISKNYASNKGAMYLKEDDYNLITGIADYIYNETPKDSNVIVAPEYLIINYYTNRKVSNPKYYNLILHTIEMFGEDNIIDDLRKNPPDYYVWTNEMFPYTNEKWLTYSTEYGIYIHSFFCENYHVVKDIYRDKENKGLYAVIYERQE